MKLFKIATILLLIFCLSGCITAPKLSTSSEPLTQQALEGSMERLEIWELMLVNEQNPISSSFSPPALEKLSGGLKIDARIAPAFERMTADAALDGVKLVVISAYRPYSVQQQIFNRKVAELKAQGYSEQQAYDETKLLIALPGTSEHQTGLALDIVTPSYYELTEGYAQTDAAKWLLENAADYGFILRYPADKTHITKISFEPWHYRYVGEEAAKRIMQSGICLEEYLAE